MSSIGCERDSAAANQNSSPIRAPDFFGGAIAIFSAILLEVIRYDKQSKAFRSENVRASDRNARNQVAAPRCWTGRSDPENPGSVPDVCHRNDLSRPSDWQPSLPRSEER